MSIQHPMIQTFYDKIVNACQAHEYHKATELFRRSDGILRLYIQRKDLYQLLNYFPSCIQESCPDLLYLQGVICAEDINGGMKKIAKSYNYLCKLNTVCRQRTTTVRLAIDCNVAFALYSRQKNDYPSMSCHLYEGVRWLSNNNFAQPLSTQPMSISSCQHLDMALEATLNLQRFYQESGNLRGHFDITLLQVWLLMEQGDHKIAELRLKVLTDRYAEHQLSDQTICEFYQIKAQLQWLRGNLEEASLLLFACRLKAVTQQEGKLQRKIERLLANLYQEQGKLEDATRWYSASKKPDNRQSITS